MCKLAVELGGARGDVNVQEAVVLLGRDIVQTLDGLYGVGRADLLEEGLKLLLGPQAANALELRQGANDRAHRRELLRRYPQRYVLVPPTAHEGI